MTAIETTRFGKVDYAAEDVVRFEHGLLGFEDKREFVLIQHKETPYRWLQSVEDGPLAFLVVDPGLFLADYAPEVPTSLADELGLTEESPRLVYTIVTIPQGKPQEMTLNLAGPILVNAESGQAKQVVLDTEEYPLKHRVFPEASKGGEAA